ncbi:MAG: hypothetical protein CM1200mP14_08870 [Gammaproteobacteria bacterium]|nr:MAG: hypothetical protein CM1200mP14_08870 [Gammaproteobacteria bacterium]
MKRALLSVSDKTESWNLLPHLKIAVGRFYHGWDSPHSVKGIEVTTYLRSKNIQR